MNDPLENLKNKWQEAKKADIKSVISADSLIEKSNSKMKSTRIMHIYNIGILLLTLIGISAFFYYITSFQTMLSFIGVGLMTGGLALRIIIECFSIYKSRQIDLSMTASRLNDEFMGFYQYRKRIQGSVTITILICYTIGFYMLIPEFGEYFSQTTTMLIALSYLLVALIFGYSIRKAIKDEMKVLNEILKLREELSKVE